MIAGSPGELQNVFQALLANATQISEASFGNLHLYEADAFRRVALHNAPEAYAADQQRDPIIPRGRSRLLDRLADTTQGRSMLLMSSPKIPMSRLLGLLVPGLC